VSGRREGKSEEPGKGGNLCKSTAASIFIPVRTFSPAGGCLQVCKCVQTNKIKGFVHHKCVHKCVISVYALDWAEIAQEDRRQGRVS